MGTFLHPIEVGDPRGQRFETLEALVDTGASYSSIPRNVLARLGVEPEEERPFILADGRRVSYGLAWIRLRLDGREQPSLVIFGDPDSEPLLGAFTLEGFGLSVEPANRRLVPTPGFLVGIRLQREP
jgi:clan AA aspartic protease